MGTPEGWGWPALAHKAHYFRDATSLCRRWMFITEDLDVSEAPSRDDCVKCRRLRDKEIGVS